MVRVTVMTWGEGAFPDSTTTEGPEAETMIKSCEYTVSVELAAMNLRVLHDMTVSLQRNGEKVALAY